jgi:hypothetical protein
MTHSLHRQGTVDNLAGDYVVFAMAAPDINDLGAGEKLREFLSIALRHGPVNLGDMKAGNMHCLDQKEIQGSIRDSSIVHAVFSQPEVVAKVLAEVKEADLGISVVVSGLFPQVEECCHRAGLKPHTVEHSLGVWGDTKQLPNGEALEFSTMCGHGMVSFNLVQEAIEDVSLGRSTTAEAALKLARPCVCGIFNPQRAEELLRSRLQMD